MLSETPVAVTEVSRSGAIEHWDTADAGKGFFTANAFNYNGFSIRGGANNS